VWPVRFDDRLKTVLAQPATSAHDAAVRWRQLVELAARAPPDGDRDLFTQAISEIREAAATVEERVRAGAALAVASLPLPVDLVAAFAADRLNIAAPILASARLTALEWKSVAAQASDDCRSFIGTMRAEYHPAQHTAPATAKESVPSISDVVARIERLRQSRDSADAASGPATGEPDQARLFRWECNESGEIEWVDGAPRGALIGQSIAQRGSGAGVDRTVERAFASRAPFHGTLELPADSAIGGTWKIGGVPAFDRSSGRFAGYRGVAERSDGADPRGRPISDPDSLRELAHEIRTPLNAIIGFAEIITGEYLGPAGSAYRERASEIVAQARLLLSAVEDLDFAAKLRSTKGAEKARCNLGELVERLVAILRETGNQNGVEIEAERSVGELSAVVQPEVAERLILRMCGAVIGRSNEGERLRLTVDCKGNRCIVSITRPIGLQGMSEEELFGSADDAMSAAFPLRLARGLAHAAGAGLEACERRISLLFPKA
jgi:hypothetical protein